MAEIISISTTNPISIRPTDKLGQAIEIMAKKKFRRLPIVYQDALVGIITAGDILEILNKGDMKLMEEEVHKFMTENPITVEKETTVSEAIQLMFMHNLGSLPIISPRDQTLAGIVTERDLVKAFSDSIADAELEEFLTLDPITHNINTVTVKQVLASMVKTGVRRAILVDKQKKVQGIVTSTDILRFCADQLILKDEIDFSVKAKDIASVNVITVPISMSVKEVTQLLVQKRMGAVPVTDDDGVAVGIFTERDLLKMIGMYNLM